MDTENKAPRRESSRENLWAKETAKSWNISTRVLLLVALKGSFFDEKNPRYPLLKKLQKLNEGEELKRVENAGHSSKTAKELREIAASYNELYLELFLKEFSPKELRVFSISSDGAVNPSQELEASARA